MALVGSVEVFTNSRGYNALAMLKALLQTLTHADRHTPLARLQFTSQLMKAFDGIQLFCISC